MIIFNLHCQIVLHISSNMLHKTRPMKNSHCTWRRLVWHCTLCRLEKRYSLCTVCSLHCMVCIGDPLGLVHLSMQVNDFHLWVDELLMSLRILSSREVSRASKFELLYLFKMASQNSNFSKPWDLVIAFRTLHTCLLPQCIQHELFQYSQQSSLVKLMNISCH